MKIWVFLDGRQQGPFQFDELRELPLTKETKVWFAGLPKWFPAGQLPELAELLTPQEEPAESAESAENSENSENSEDSESSECPECSPAPAAAPAPPLWEPQPELAPAPPMWQPEFMQQPPAPPCPSDHLAWSIISTILLFSPIALVAIFFSAGVNRRYRAGNLAGAKRYSDVAAWLIMIAWALGFMPFMLLIAML